MVFYKTYEGLHCLSLCQVFQIFIEKEFAEEHRVLSSRNIDLLCSKDESQLDVTRNT